MGYGNHRKMMKKWGKSRMKFNTNSMIIFSILAFIALALINFPRLISALILFSALLFSNFGFWRIISTFAYNFSIGVAIIAIYGIFIAHM
jgi:hypothetical protein